MLEYVIEGHDGAAKTPIANGVKKELEKENLTVIVRNTFQMANALLNHDIYHLWQNDDNAELAVNLLKLVVNNIRQEAQEKNADVILYDRHWVTVMGEIQGRESLQDQWSYFPPTFFIGAPIEKTLECSRFSYEIPWTSSNEVIEQGRQKHLQIANKYQEHILGTYEVKTKDQPLNPIINDITRKILEGYQ
jgi:thymidylate kinase